MNSSSLFKVPHYRCNSKIVFVSSCCYCLAFYDLENLFWCIIPSIVLLYHVLRHNKSLVSALGFGVLWAGVVYGFHCGGMVYSLYLLKPHYIWVVVWMVATLYCMFYVCCLFVACAVVCRVRIIAFVGVALCISLHFWIVDAHALWIFGVEGGYCLANPLIPLSRFFIREPHPVPESFCIIRTSHKPFQAVDPRENVRAFFKLVACERMKNNTLCCIITPESALPFALNKYENILKIFCNYSHALPLLMGSFFEDDHGVHNCFYYFSDGILQCIYKKKHAMPCAEMIPQWCNYAWVRELFLNNNQCARSKISGERQVISLSDVHIYPIICSEFFCTAALKKVPRHTTALVLVNDAWFAHSFLSAVAYHYAALQAWWCGKKIIYVSFFKDGCL